MRSGSADRAYPLPFIALLRHGNAQGLYTNGIIESCFAIATDHDCLQVRAYVDETRVHNFLTSSKPISRMLIRETNTSVPLTFVHVSPNESPTTELSEEWQERVHAPVLPVIFRFDPLPNVTVHPGQLVDIYIGER
jgi:HlyD family secretion protein